MPGETIQYTPPQQTANDVVNYAGNAALGGGFDSRGIPTGGGGEADPIGMLKSLQGQQFMRNTAKYNAALQDRADSLKALNDPSLQMGFDIADEDRPAMEEQRQKIMDMWKANPAMDEPEAVVNFQKEAGKFREMAASSKSRNLERMKMNLAIANEQNPAVRNSMIDHLHQQLGKGVMGQIDPYFSNPSFDASMFADVPAQQVGQTEFKPDASGAYYANKTMRTPVKAFADFVAPTNLMANNGALLQKLQLMHDNFATSPFSQDPNTLTAMNTKLDQINKENNIPANDPAYLQPVATANPDGSWKVNDSPAQFGKSMYAYTKYNNKSSSELAPDYQKSMHEVQEDKKLQADISRENITGAAMADKYRADAEKARKEGNLADAKANEDKAEVSAPAADVISMFHDATDPHKWQSYSDPDIVSKKFSAGALQQFKNVGYAPGMQITPLPLTNNYRLALSTLVPSKKDGNETTGSYVQKPAKVFAIHKPGGDMNDVTLVGFDGSDKMIKAVNMKEALTETMKANNNYSNDPKLQHKIDMARQVMDEQLAGNKPTTGTAVDPPVAKPKKDPKDYQTYSPSAATGLISKQEFDKTRTINGLAYYQIEGGLYDSHGNYLGPVK